MVTYLFLTMATIVAIDMGIRIIVYRKTHNPDVKHKYKWWEV